MSSPLEVAASTGFGLLAGTLSGFLGIGGGAVLAPLLVAVLGVEQHRAQGVSLAALVPPVGLPAVLAYRRAGVRIDVRFVVLLVVGFVGGVVVGAWLAHRVPSRELRWIFAAYLAVSAFREVRRKREVTEPGDDTATPPGAVGPLVGLAAGVVSGLLGVGGGLVALPLLRRFGRMGRLEAQATTLAMLLPPIGLPAVFVYAEEQGGLPWELLAAVGLGFAAGAGLGARLVERVDEVVAARVYAGFLAIMAVVLVARP